MLARRCRIRLSHRNRLYSRTQAPATLHRPTPNGSHAAPSQFLSTRILSWRDYATTSDADPKPPSEDTIHRYRDISVTTHYPASTSGPSDLPDHLQNLRAHLAAALLPVNQPTTTSPSSTTDMHTSTMTQRSEDGNTTRTTTLGFPNDDGLGETVLGLASPFEGGECYNRDAVLKTAGQIGAEVVRIDLTMAIGLSDVYGIKGARIPDKKNPLLFETISEAEDDDGEDDMDFSPEGHMKIPVMTLGNMPPPGRPSASIEVDWVAVFQSLINVHDSENPRIILLEACSTMLPTFPLWWPSLAEAVRGRRRQPRPTSGRKTAKSNGWELGKPTTIVLSFAPSLLDSHTGAADTDGTAHNSDDDIWWGSAESDDAGRRLRENYRLETLRDSQYDARQLIPSSDPPRAPAANPILAALASKFGSQQTDSEADERKLLWKALPIIPLERDIDLESDFRSIARCTITSGLLARALKHLQLGVGDLAPFQSRLRSSPWSDRAISWHEAQSIAVRLLGQRGKASPLVSVEDLVSADAARKRDQKQLSDRVDKILPPPTQPSSGPDPVVSAIRKASDLNKYEKRLLPCIVDAQKLASTDFSRVHLPLTTIDAVRTMVSLPLLYPEAFKSGILGEHSAGGALLFGPPGTGKTLLARAVAAESGARMLAIQPSDVNDMYVGEGEKLVRAAFSLARRLSPCVVFIDEVDSLFAARSGKDSSGGGRSHNQILTEFMQEMDGLNSAVSNREQSVVVVGATNRPFDLDEAVLRRLPRRLLIDLPGLEDREAILCILLQKEELARDVDLAKLASLTDGFSGSDLKHLCVAAALAALKQTVELPWSKISRDGSPTVKRPDHTNGPPAMARPTAADDPAPPDQAIRRTVELRNDAGMITATGSGSLQLSTRRYATASIDGAVPDTPISSKPAASSRILEWKHFEVALSEISPSSTEDGALPELRKWAEQYGDGGSKRAPRKGFGKTFGFGNLVQAPDGRYGRVKLEE